VAVRVALMSVLGRRCVMMFRPAFVRLGYCGTIVAVKLRRPRDGCTMQPSRGDYMTELYGTTDV
jgi:hypothetical protein